MANDNVNLTEISDASGILKLFEEHHQAPTFDPVPYLSRCVYLLIIFHSFLTLHCHFKILTFLDLLSY